MESVERAADRKKPLFNLSQFFLGAGCRSKRSRCVVDGTTKCSFELTPLAAKSLLSRLLFTLSGQ